MESRFNAAAAFGESKALREAETLQRYLRSSMNVWGGFLVLGGLWGGVDEHLLGFGAGAALVAAIVGLHAARVDLLRRKTGTFI